MQKNKVSVRSLTETALSAALIAVSAMICIPFPIPFTLQLFGVYLALFYLGGVRGSFAVLLYFTIGAVGLPVFSGFTGGVGRILDATGGFIIGFLVLALVYLVTERLLGRSRFALCLSVALSLLAFYLSGSLWYAFVYNGGEGYFASLLVTVLPFVIPDILKILLARAVATRLLSIFYKKSFEKQKND